MAKRFPPLAWALILTMFLNVSLVVGTTTASSAAEPAKPASSEASVSLPNLADAADESLKRYISQLNDPDWLVRQVSAEALGELRAPRALDALLAALQDSRAEVRQSAAGALEHMPNPRAVEPLIAALGQADGLSDAEAIVRALAQTRDPRAVGPIALALRRKVSPVRPSEVRDIALFRDLRIANALIEAVRREDGSLDQNTVGLLVWRMKEKRMLPLLVEDLRSAEGHSSNYAADALGRLGDPAAVAPLIEALGSPSASLREAAAKALGQLSNESAAAPLLARLQTGNEKRDVLAALAGALGRVGGEECLPPLQALQTGPGDDRDSVKVAAATAIEDIRLGAFRARRQEGETRAAAVAREGLKDESKDRQRAAIRALREIGTDASLAAIVEALRDPDGPLRHETPVVGMPPAARDAAPRRPVAPEAIQALAWFEGPPANDALARSLDDSQEENRWAATGILADRGDPRAVPALIAALQSQDVYRRRSAAELLGRKLRDARAVPPLCALLSDPERRVRTAAAEALMVVADDRALEPLLQAVGTETDERIRLRLLWALGRIHQPRAIAALEKALADRSDEINHAAARSLAREGWKPSNDTQRIRYLVALGREGESPDAIPRATASEGKKRLDGKFLLDTPILTPLTMGTKEFPEVVMLHRIEFHRKGDETQAALQINYTSWPDSAWIIRIALLGKSDETMATAEKKYRVQGARASYAMTTNVALLDFSFGKIADLSGIQRFVVTVEQTLPGPASYQWFQNPSNGHFYCLTDRMTWPQAEVDAQRHGGYLATVGDADENEWLHQTFTDTGCPMFIGLTDRDEESVWRWVNGESAPYRHWQSNEPNNAGGAEDGVELGPRGEWNDLGFEIEGRGIVERDTAPPPSGASADNPTSAPAAGAKGR